MTFSQSKALESKALTLAGVVEKYLNPVGVNAYAHNALDSRLKFQRATHKIDRIFKPGHFYKFYKIPSHL